MKKVQLLLYGVYALLLLSVQSLSAQTNALNFDGTNDYVTAAHNTALNITATLSVEAWIKTSATDERYIVTKNGSMLYMAINGTSSAAGKLSVYLDGATAAWTVSNATVADGTWHHVAFTRNGTTLKLYVDGVLDKTVTINAAAIVTNTGPLTIGMRDNAGFFSGSMDELRIWNTERTATEIANNRSCEIATNATGLVAYYKFNEGIPSGTNTGLTTTADATANNITGTPTNFTKTGAASNWVTGNVNAVVTPSVLIAANPSNTITAGTSVTFTATPTNGGTTPQYQWKKGNVSVVGVFNDIAGATSATYTATTLANNDLIRCVLTSNATCATPTTKTSSVITMTVTCPTSTTLYVDASKATSGNGETWATAFKDLQAALTAARSCTNVTEIWVAKGTYKPTTTGNRDVSFSMLPNVKIYGSFAGTETTLSQRTAAIRAANPSVLSGDLNGDDVVTGSGSTLSITNNGENSRHVVFNDNNGLTTTNALLDGFTITGGNSDDGNSVNGNGGGMLNNTASPSLSNLVFVANSGTGAGQCGGMANRSASPTLNNVVFARNFSRAGGGGMYNIQSSPILNNVVFWGNRASFPGGGMYNSQSSPILTQVTFANNSAPSGGGGLNNAYGSSSNLTNCIFWGNSSGIFNGSDFLGTSTATVTYSLVQGGFTGTGNISTDPLFVDAANPAGSDGFFMTDDDGLRLQATSPCLNTGNNTGISGTDLDILGNLRIANTTVDMGAYEAFTMGAALNFDGTNDKVSITSGIDLSNKAYTIEFWAKPKGAINANRFVCGQGPAATGQGLHIGFIGGGTFYFSQFNNQLTASGLYDDGVWHHFACVNDPYSTSGKRRIIYRDGVEVASDNSSQPFPTASGTFIIGTHPFGGDFFNGDIDEFRIWYRALSACEIPANKGCELPATGNADLAAYYKFNQGVVDANNTALTSLTDASGNNRNGTFQNMALTGATSNFVATGGVTTGTSCTALATPSVSIAANPSGTITLGTSVTFTATPTNGGTTPTYVWKNNSVVISGQTAATYTSTTLAHQNGITCEMTPSSCTSPAMATSNVVTMSVNVTPSVIVASNYGTTACAGQPTTFTATPTNGGTTPTYVWKKNGTTINGQTAATYIEPTVVANDVFSCILTSSLTNVTTATATSNALTMSVGQPESPVVTATPTTVCAGTPSNLVATTSIGTIDWYDAQTGGTLLTNKASGATYAVTPSVSTTYYGQIKAPLSTQTFNATGGTQQFTVPSGVTSLRVVAAGAKGSNFGGSGGTLSTTLAVTSGETLTLEIGTLSGYNGGGISNLFASYNGGGGTDIRRNGTTLTSRVVVAGGGGGFLGAGAGGGLIGGNGRDVGVNGGNQTGSTGSGLLGKGGAGNLGGGGGYYGGAASNGSNGGGGGSSYTDPALCTNVVHTQGNNAGDGYITLSWESAVCVSTTRVPVTVTVNPIVTPSVSIASSGGTTVCAGASVTFTATPTNGGTTPTYIWRKGNVAISGATAATYTTTTLASGDAISCAMTSNAPCATTTTATSNALTISVSQPESPVVTATPTTVCAGTPSNLVGTASVGTIDWYNAATGGTLLTNKASGATYAVTPSVTTTYYAQIKAPTSPLTFTATGVAQTFVVPSGVTRLRVVAAGAKGAFSHAGKGGTVSTTLTVTSGETLTLSVGDASGYGGGGGGGRDGSSSFAGGGGTDIRRNGTALSNRVVVAGGGGGYYGASGGGLEGSSVGLVGSTGSGGTQSQGGAGDFADSGSLGFGGSSRFNGGGGGGYYGGGGGYDGGGGGSSYTDPALCTNVVHVQGNNAGDGYITLSWESAVCVSATRVPVTVTINPIVTPSVSIASSGGTTVCAGASVTFTATPTNGGTMPTYIWRKGNVAISGATAATYTTTTLASGDVISCAMTSNDPCATTTTATSNALTMSVTPLESPVVSATPTTVCAGTPSNLVGTASVGTIDWYNAATGGTLLTNKASGAAYAVTPSVTTTYYAQINVPSGTQTFNATGATQTFVVPAGVTSLMVTAAGAQGTGIGFPSPGGLGGTVTTLLSVTPGETLTLEVGNQSRYNGGGASSFGSDNNGGGGTDIRKGGTTLMDRVVVAGGGGIGFLELQGGAGGDLIGGNGSNTTGGTQIAGGTGANISGDGALGVGGAGGGGGGYWGGGGPGTGNGGGGSSYTDLTLCTNVVHTQGNNAGNGYITLSWAAAACVSTTRVPVTVTVEPNVTPSVSIAANPSGTITSGTSVTFTATPRNGGTMPTYVWQKNGTAISGATAATYTSTTLANGDLITCVLTNTCGRMYTSDAIQMTVTTPSAALNFDGSDDYVNVPHHSSLALNGAFTIETWITVATPTGLPTVFSKNGDQLAMWLEGSETETSHQWNLRASVGGTTIISPSFQSLNENLPYHVALTFDGTTAKLYINGTPAGSASTGAPNTGTQPLLIGQWTSGRQFQGNVDELRVWNRALSGCEINTKMNCELPNTGNLNLAAYYPFNQGTANSNNSSVSSLTDVSGNNLNGTLNNFALTGTTSNWIAEGSVTTGNTCAAFTPVLVAIAANPSGAITAGTSVTFTATPTNEGTTPQYQWYKNGNDVGTSGTTYTDAALIEGDVISCSLINPSAVCPASSNEITMTVICPSSTTLYVNASIATSGNGETWATAFKTLNEALTSAATCTNITQIWVAKGTYKPTTTTNRDVSFSMLPNVKIYGSFAGTETMLSQRTAAIRGANPSVLSGDLSGDDVVTGSGSTLSITNIGENSRHVVFNDNNGLTTTNALLDGFTITGGNADNGNNPVTTNGGGMLNNTASPSLSNLVFVANSATGTGQCGGMANQSASPTLNNVVFARNFSRADGGGMYNSLSSPILNNVVFWGNQGSSGGMFNYSSSPNLTNVTFANNGGDAIFNILSANPILKNCLVWGNSGGIVNYFGGTATVTYSLVQGGFTGTGNIDADPLFVDAANPAGADGIFLTADDGLRLQSTSPAINAGTTPTPSVPTDILGNARVSSYDMGAYESSVIACPTSTTLYVNASIATSGNGETWATAYKDLQSALTQARTCTNVTQIWVAKGTYYPTATTDRSISFSMINNVSIIGGFGGTETALSERVLKNNPTILSGDIGVVGTSSDNTQHVFFHEINGLDLSAVLDGFTITGGNAEGSNLLAGGGMVNVVTSVTLLNIVFSNNVATNAGGGGLFSLHSTCHLTNVIFVNNTSNASGSGVDSRNSNLVLTNVTFYNNTMYGEDDNITLKNCIVRGSITHSSSTFNITYSNVEGGFTGTGNIDADPLFVDAANPAGADGFFMTDDDGLRLQNTSPAINTGTTPTPSVPTDILGNSRVSSYDMGAYESSVVACPTSTILYVDASIATSGNGETWATAYKDLQAALTKARTCTNITQIWVAKGTYFPTATTDRTISFSMINNVSIIGGFAGTETALSQRVLKNNPTILSGDIGTVGSNADNTQHIFFNNTNSGNGVDATAILDGFTITSGNATGASSSNGGGMYISNCSPTLINIVFANNTGSLGGAFYTVFGAPNLTNVVFVNNAAANGGGGIYIYRNFIDMVLNNVTFHNNTASHGGAIFNDDAAIIIKNSIIWGTTFGFRSPSTTITYSLVQGGYTGTGNISSDPLFVDATNPAGADGIFLTDDDGLRLQGISPAINTGTTPTPSVPTDILGNPRVSSYDMGAYESSVVPCDCDPSCSPIATGAGTYTATRSKVNGLYTHYCNGNNLLLSIKTPTNSTVVPFGAVKLKIGVTAATHYSQYCGGTDVPSSCFVIQVGGGALMNRVWHIDSALVTGSVVSSLNQLTVVSYFSNIEYTGLNQVLLANSIPGLSSQTQLKFYVPKLSYKYPAFSTPSVMKPMDAVLSISNGAAPSTTVWQHSVPQTGVNRAEYRLRSLGNSFGLGKFD